MSSVRRTVVWLVLLGLIVACALSGCKKQEETPAGGAGTQTSQGETADPNA